MAKKSKVDRAQTMGWTTAEKWWWPIGIITYLLLAIWAIVLGPDLLVSESSRAGGRSPALSNVQYQTAVAAARQSVLLAAGGGLALITLIVTVSRDAIGRGRAQQERDEQVSSQFTEAIGQLTPSQTLSIRLGGIYALERIAMSSPQHRLGALAVLAQYIREHAEVPDSQGADRALGADVETSAEVIARITSNAPASQPLSLARANLYGTNMRSANLNGWTLDAAEARFTNLNDAQLLNASMSSARLQGTTFCGANLTTAGFVHAVLDHADLAGCRAIKTDFSHSEMSSVSFKGANLQAAVFTGVVMKIVDFSDADLTEAAFTRADLSGADFRTAKGFAFEQVLDARTWDENTKWPESFGTVEVRR